MLRCRHGSLHRSVGDSWAITSDGEGLAMAMASEAADVLELRDPVEGLRATHAKAAPDLLERREADPPEPGHDLQIACH